MYRSSIRAHLLIGIAFITFFTSPIYAQVPYVFKNTSAVNKLSYTDDQIYIYTQLGMPGMNGYFNTSTAKWENINTAPSFVGPDGKNYTAANIKLSDMPKNASGQYFLMLPQGSSGRIYIGFGSPIYTITANNPILDSPGNPNYNTKIETIELTVGGQIFTNTSRVDRYAYPMGEELYCSNGAFYDKVGETVSHEQVIAKWKLFVNDDFQNSYDPLRDIITQMGHTPYFQKGKPGNNYFDAFIDELFTYYRTHTLSAQWGGVIRTASVTGNTMTWNNGTSFQRSDFVLEDMVGGVGAFNTGIGQILGVCINRGCVQLTTATQVWDNTANFFKNPIKNDYTHFFHSDFVSFEAKTYALAYDDVFNQSSTQSCPGVADSVVVSLGGFGLEHAQTLSGVYIDPRNQKVDQFKTFQFTANGLDQGQIDMDIPSGAILNWSVKEPNGNSSTSLITNSGLFGPATVLGDYLIRLEVIENGVTYKDSTIIKVEAAGSASQVCKGAVGTKANYKLEVIGQRVYITLETLPAWVNSGTVQLFYGAKSALNTMPSNVLIPNQKYYLDGFFFGDEVYFYIFSSQNGGTPNNAPVHIQSLGTCLGLEVEEAIINISTTQNVSIDQKDTYQIPLTGLTNKANSVTNPDVLFKKAIIYSGIGVDANGLFTPPGLGDFVIQISYDGIVISTTIKVSSKDCFSTIDLGLEKNICEGNSIIITVPNSSTYTAISYSGNALPYLDQTLLTAPQFISTKAGTYTLNISAKDQASCTASGSVSIVVQDKPVVSLPNLVDVCQNSGLINVNATVNITGGTGFWTNSTKVSETKSTYNPSSIGTTNIGFEYVLNACSTQAITSIKVNAIPDAPLVSQETALSSSISEQNKVPGLCATGASIKWYASPNTSLAVLSTLNCLAPSFKDLAPVDGFMDAGEYLLYATQTINGCESISGEGKLLVIDCPAPAPTAKSYHSCEGNSALDLTANGSGRQLAWFLEPIANPVLGQENFLGTTWNGHSITHLGLDSVYVAEYDSISKCFGAYSLVTIEIHQNPQIIAPLLDTVCSSESLIDLTFSPSNALLTGAGVVLPNQWSPQFDASKTGFTTTSLNLKATESYGSINEIMATCSSSLDFEIAVAHVLNILGTGIENTIVENSQNIENLPAMNLTFDETTSALLYVKDTSGNIINGGLSTFNMYDSHISGIGKYSYEVFQLLHSCSSDTVLSNWEIIDCPVSAPLTQSYHACETSPSVAFSASGTGGQLAWFLEPIANPVLGQENFLGTTWNGHSITHLGLDSVYVAEYDSISKCFGAYSLVTVEIHQNPQIIAPLLDTVCSSESLIDLIFSPSNALLTGAGVVLPNQWSPQFDASKTGFTTTSLNLKTTESYGSINEIMATCSSSLDFEIAVAHVLNISGTGIENTIVENSQNIENLPAMNLTFDETSSALLYVKDISGNVINGGLSTFNMYDSHISGIGKYSYEVFQLLHSCSSDTVLSNWEIIDCPTAAPSTSDLAICSGEVLPKLMTLDSGENYVWTLADKTTIISTEKEMDLSLKPTHYEAVGEYSFFVSKEGLDAAGKLCRGAQSELKFTIRTLPKITLEDQIICENTELNLVPIIESSNVITRYEWKELGEVNVLSDLENLEITPQKSTSYTLFVSDEKACFSRDTILVNVLSLPKTHLIASDSLICLDENIQIHPDKSVNPAYSYQWFYGEGINSFIAIDNQYVIETNLIGYYYLKITNETTCSTLSDTIELKKEMVDVQAFASKDSLQEEEVVMLSAFSSNSKNTFVWQTPNGFQNATDIEYLVSETTLFSVIAKGNKCSDTASIQVFVDIPLQIPNGFSPNGDGKNDTWNIKGLPLNTLKVSVFNRWGALVYDYPQGYNDPWKGVNKSGEELPIATYYYVISSETDPSIKFNGSVTILR